MEKEKINQKDGVALQVYEVGYHIVPSVAVENLPKEVEVLKNFLIGEGALIASEEFPKMIDLAYAMDKKIDGAKQRFDYSYFGWIKFEADSKSLGKIKKFLDDNGNVLRFLLIKTVRENTLFSAKAPVIAIKEEAKSSKGDSIGKEIKSPISEEELDKTIDKLIAE